MNKQIDRRKFLKSVGYGSLVLSIGSVAQAQTKKSLTQATQLAVDPTFLELKFSDPKAVKTLNLTARLPGSTSITKMGLDRKGLAQLSKAATQLTKADLQAMAQGKIPGRAKELTVADINSIKIAFGNGYQMPGALAADISCCCCTPCCCAAAVEPLAA